MALGKFITFEGGEGSGKSTQAKRLAERLNAAGNATLLTREPGGSPFAERVRALILDPATPSHGPLAEALLFSAARADHLAETIRPALNQGRWVISDRFSDSTLVYQGHAGSLSPQTLAALEMAVVGDTHPDLTLIIDIPADEGLRRAAARRTSSIDPYEARTLAFHERLRAGFLEVAKSEPQRCVVIDGSQSEEGVADAVWHAVQSRLFAKGS